MKAICFDEAGGSEVLYLGEVETPRPGPQQVLVKVGATALNRADLLQRQGLYPPPPGDSEILGLEMAGTVVELGNAVSKWKTGDRVFGLIRGGGYAAYALIHEDMALAIPSEWDFHQAAAIPEVFLTAFQALSWLGKLQAGERVLFHAGGSGVGTAGIQIARRMGAEVWVTASAGKHKICLSLGASQAIDYKKQDFLLAIQSDPNPGVNLIIDFIAASYFSQNLECLRPDGRLVILALLGGSRASDTNLGTLLRKRLSVLGSTLRARDLAYKIRLNQDMWSFCKSGFKDGSLKPVIDRVYPWTEVTAAHDRMASNMNVGKIILKMEE